MTSTRAPSVAGHFYPADAAALSGTVGDLTRDASPTATADAVAVISPHAGYRWSGPVAASAHTTLAARATPIERVVLAGPTHRVRVRGVGVSSADVFSTPLGELPVDRDAVAELQAAPGVVVADRSHRHEYSVEVQLPFVQELMGEVPIVPLVVGGDAPPWLVADALERVWTDDSTVAVISSDLSHHHPIDEARSIDDETSRLVERTRIEQIDGERMCGAAAVKGLLKVAQRRHLNLTTVDLRNSGDFGGPPDRVVGYGAYAVSASDAPAPHPDHDARIVDLAVAAARARIRGGAEPTTPDDLPAALARPSGVFVSATVDGELRGCVGSIEARDPLAEAVIRLAARAVSADRRFSPVGTAELDRLALDIHLLSPLERIPARSIDELAAQLIPGHHGVVLSEHGQSTTFLPVVWDTHPDPERFVAELVTKGAFDERWTPARASYRYTTRRPAVTD